MFLKVTPKGLLSKKNVQVLIKNYPTTVNNYGLVVKKIIPFYDKIGPKTTRDGPREKVEKNPSISFIFSDFLSQKSCRNMFLETND